MSLGVGWAAKWIMDCKTHMIKGSVHCILFLLSTDDTTDSGQGQ